MMRGIACAWSGFLGRGTGSASRQPPPFQLHTKTEPVRRHEDWLEHHTAEEHALLLLTWIQRNIDPRRGMLFREAVQEFYTEALIEVGWGARPWNRVARELDLLCTGGRKPYQWVMSKTGRMHRRRHYPIPDLVPAQSANALRAA
jgi:hypothetical protein